MIKFSAAMLALSLFSVSLSGSAKEAAESPPGATQRGSAKFPSYCSSNSGIYTGNVVGVGGNWWAQNAFPFTISNNSGTYTETGAWGYDDDKGNLMLSLVSMAYMTGATITLYCGGSGNVGSVWLDGGMPQ